MHFLKFKLENYKSFRSSEDLSFTPGFNVIVGRNDVGKTALVEGLGLDFGTISHHSEKTIPYRGDPMPLESQAYCTIHLPGDELRDILLGLPQFFLPLLSKGDEDTSVRRFNELLTTGADLAFRWKANAIDDIQFPQYLYPSDTPNLAALVFYRQQRGATTWTPASSNTQNRHPIP
jgi:hypothetical protein